MMISRFAIVALPVLLMVGADFSLCGAEQKGQDQSFGFVQNDDLATVCKLPAHSS